jgi:hypothetical protein
LKAAYKAVCDNFELPSDAAEEVCLEIESHSGLILKSYDHFEFSHLSLQEYLCAYHMVRLPFEPIMSEYLIQYPAPIAVAVSISADPSSWLSSLIYHSKQFDSGKRSIVRFGDIPEEAAFSLLSRLLVEAPVFSQGHLFGLALLRLLSSFSTLDALHKERQGAVISEPELSKQLRVITILRSFLKMKGILESINSALDLYFFDSAKNLSANPATFVMQHLRGGRGRYSDRLAYEIHVRASVVRFLEDEFEVNFQWLTAEGDVARGKLPF